MAKDFKNILENLKKNSNDFLWISRAIHFIKAFKQHRPRISPNQLKTIVAESSHMNKVFDEVSFDKAKERISDILEELGYKYDLAVIRWLGLVLIKILRRSLSGLYVNENKLKMIASEMGTSPVIFVPTHRSYCDFVLMAFICFKYNINIPCVAAGMDFLSMRLMNNVLRKSKAFFMRRKFSDDPIYRSVFQDYIRAMISFEESPIEFFIEGTRSRTGKSLSPKFGFLTMVVNAYLSGDIPDLTIIPINISYDRVLEETLFAYELLGIPKPKESTKGLLKALKVLDENYGNVHINFGEPFSVRSFFDNDVDFTYRCPEKESNIIRQIAFQITQMQQSLQIYGCFHILALVLYDYVVKTSSYTLALEDAVRNSSEIILLCEHYGANVYIDGDLESSIKQSINVHNTIIDLSADNMLTLKKTKLKPQVNQCENTRGCKIDERIIEEAVPLIMLQIYVNPSLNLFIRSSIILTILNCMSIGNEITTDVLYQNYQYLCDIFKHEFVLNNSDFKDCNDSILKLMRFGIIDLCRGSIKLINRNSVFYFLLNLLKPFLIAAYQFCEFLLEPGESYDNPQKIIKGAQQYISVKITSGEIKDFYCLSLDLLSNITNSLSDMKVVVWNKRNNELFINKELINDLSHYTSCLVNGAIHPQFITKNSYICNKKLKSKL